MRNKLSVLIIDPQREGHDYNITTDGIVNVGETAVDVNVVDSAENINSTLAKYRGYDCIVSIGNVDVSPLSNSSFEIRKKWVHFSEYDKEAIANALVNTFILNIERDRGEDKLFSIFTCTFNTPKAIITRLYESLKNQTYKNWNWWVLDDSTFAGSVSTYLEKFNDPRIIVIKNITNHGVIGFNKHVIASACDGDFLVEIDHDDELTSDCLELLKRAFDTYPDADFAYSHAMEEMDGLPITYGNNFALGQGYYAPGEVNGVKYKQIAMTPDVNCLTLRHIVGLPNHVRCWKKDFYHRVGGHNIELAVLDDMDLLIRTFLHGKICKVDKVLYVQHEGSSTDNNGRGSTTQGSRLGEIQRTGVLLKWKYDQLIHNKLLELGVDDVIWDEEHGYSVLRSIKDKLPSLNYVLEVDNNE